MNKMRLILSLIGGVGAVVVPIVIWQLSQNQAEVQFTLSDPIRLGEALGSKIWQQIEVRNKGNVEAKNVQVKTAGEVLQYDIAKNSEADQPQVFSGADVFELVYPSLPATGAFTLTLSLAKARLNLDDMSVRHSKGSGIEAFKRKSRLGIYLWLAFTLPMLAFYAVGGARMMILDRLTFDASYRPIDRVLERNKPVGISQNKWASIRSTAIKEAISPIHMGTDIAASKAYRILDQSRPAYLNEDEWEKLREVATSKIMEGVSNRLRWFASSAEDVLPVLELRQPANMYKGSWSGLMKEANERFLQFKSGEIRVANTSKLGAILDQEMPKTIEPEIREKLLELAIEQYTEKIERDLRFSEAPHNFLNEELPAILGDKAAALKDTAYRRALTLLPDVRFSDNATVFIQAPKPEWLKDEDYARFRKSAEMTLELASAKEDCRKKSALFEKQQSEVSAMSQELSKKLPRINSQLEILNEVLSDPTVVDRIEDYNNAFAPGNFENLRRIAQLIKQEKLKGARSTEN